MTPLSMPEIAGRRDRIGSEQLDALFGAVLVGVASAAVAAWIVVALLVSLEAVAFGPGIGWALYITICALLHSALGVLRARLRPAIGHWRPWALAFTVVAFFEGLGWGLLPLLAGSSGHFDVEMLGAATTVAVAAGSIVAFSPFMPAFAAFLFPAMLPYIGWTLLTGHDPLHRTVMILAVLFTVAIFLLARILAHRYAALIRLQIEKDEQVELAARANGVLSSFLGMASHELRQPVQALNNWVGVLGNIRLPAEAQRPLEVIQQQTIKVDQIFNALLDLSLLDAGKVKPRLRAFALAPVLQGIHADALPIASGKGLRLRLVQSGAVTFSDAVMVERVISNLVRNAIRYTETGTVLVGCRRRQGQALAIQVIDTGPGIERDERTRIFEPFYQVDRPSAGRSEGVGLGLAIVKRLCDLLDAGLKLVSEPGRGTMFEIVLPVAATAVLEQDVADKTPQTRLSGLIVVVDDDVAILESMSALLKQWGQDVVATSAGANALAVLAKRQQRPLLIISDFQLHSGENGIDLIERLRMEYNEDIPALLMTGDAGEEIAVRARAANLPLLLKPVSNSRLHAAISNLTASAPAGAQNSGATLK